MAPPDTSAPRTAKDGTTSLQRGTFFGMKTDMSKFQKGSSILPTLKEQRASEASKWRNDLNSLDSIAGGPKGVDIASLHRRMTHGQGGVSSQELGEAKTLNDIKIKCYNPDIEEGDEDDFEFDENVENPFENDMDEVADGGEDNWVEASKNKPATLPNNTSANAKARGRTLKLSPVEARTKFEKDTEKAQVGPELFRQGNFSWTVNSGNGCSTKTDN